jgi:glycosyltransferase involved in cell wall biosynthesis
MLRVSVVIPTAGRPELLRRCLDAVAAQTLSPRDFEVIVVDDRPDPETTKIVRALATSNPALSVRMRVTRGRCGPAVARNLGWRAARAPIIAFTDDDTIPAPTWLDEGLRALTPPAVAVHGRVIVPTPDVPTDYERNTKGLEGAGFVTANCLVLKEALEKVGGFDERFRRAWREDTDLYFSLIEHAGPVLPAPGAVITHPVRPGRWGECLRQHANLVFDALLYKKHPSLYRRVVLARPPWSYYVAVVGMSGAAGLMLAGRTSISIVVALVALLPIADLARRRLSGTSPDPKHRLEVLITSLLIPFFAVYWRLRGAIRFRVAFL